MKKGLLGMAVMGAAILLALVPPVVDRAEAGGPPDVVHVNGGGTGLFVEPSITPTDQGLTTNFSVGAKIFEDGSASGHFVCLIPGVLVINGQYTAGSFDTDTGVATLSGDAIIYFVGDEPILVEFTNTFTDGGAGVGGFTLSETSGFFPNYPEDVDTELVIKGRINIQ